MRYNEATLYDSRGCPQIKLYHSTTASGTRPFIPHHHTECELSLIVSGGGIYSVTDKTYNFRAGDIFLFNSDEIHCITEIFPQERFDVLNIHFEPRLLWSAEGFGSTSLLKIFFCRSASFENLIDRDNPETAKARRLITEIETELLSCGFEYGLCAKNKLCEILISLSRNYGYIDTEENPLSHEHNTEKMLDLMNYIRENLSSDIKLSELADYYGINKTYFCSLFKKYNGISPFEYITIKRVEKAIYLLKNSSRTKFDIAAECGFNSMSNFYKAFSAVTGKKPGDFQKHN